MPVVRRRTKGVASAAASAVVGAAGAAGAAPAADDPQVLVSSKHLDADASGTGRPDTVLVVSLTAHDRDASTRLHLELDALGGRARLQESPGGAVAVAAISVG